MRILKNLNVTLILTRKKKIFHKTVVSVECSKLSVKTYVQAHMSQNHCVRVFLSERFTGVA